MTSSNRGQRPPAMSRPSWRLRRCTIHLRRNRRWTSQLFLAVCLFPLVLWIGVSALAAHTSFGMPNQLIHSRGSKHRPHLTPHHNNDQHDKQQHDKTKFAQSPPPRIQNVLFVTAHPDDEALFFGPTILQLTRRDDVRTSLLVLSSGKFLSTTFKDGQAFTRQLPNTQANLAICKSATHS
jgi:hypothetical protein